MRHNPDIKAIEKFLANGSSHHEAEEIAAYLQANEAILEKLIPFDKTSIQAATPEEKIKILQKITGRRTASAKVISFARLAAAAAIIGIITAAVVWVANHSKSDIPTAGIAAHNTVSNKNTSGSALEILLPDSSLATLEPWAEILYDSTFAQQREVFLSSGTARFDVRKNAERPFSVYARGIKTTALGTVFLVESPLNAETVTVKLESGKVLLQSVDRAFAMTELTLTPGQTCLINKATGKVQVYNTAKKTAVPKPATSVPAVQEDHKSVLWTNHEMQFSKARLGSVLAKLEARYHVAIVADKSITERSVITGKIFNTDSLHKIIKSICDINNLSYEMRNDSVFLRKRAVD